MSIQPHGFEILWNFMMWCLIVYWNGLQHYGSRSDILLQFIIMTITTATILTLINRVRHEQNNNRTCAAIFEFKPWPSPMMAYFELDHWEQISVKLNTKCDGFFAQENDFGIVVCKIMAILYRPVLCIKYFRKTCRCVSPLTDPSCPPSLKLIPRTRPGHEKGKSITTIL